MSDETTNRNNPLSAENRTPDGTPSAQAPSRPEAASRALPDDALIILPVRNVVMFPGAVFPITVGRERSRTAAQEAVRLERPLGVLLQSKPDVDEPGPDDLHWVGTSASVIRYITTPDGLHHAIARGLRRFRVLQFLDGYPFAVARVQFIDDPAEDDAEIEGRARTLKERAIEILQLLPQVPEEMVAALQAVEGPARLADFIAGLMDVSAEEKQALLETFDLKTRLDKVLQLLSHRIEVLKVSREIDERTRESISDVNRKHLLREQMRQIQKELGEGDEGNADIADLERAITDAHMPEEVDKAARKELKRLERMPEAAGEYSMVRTYLEWLIELPWTNDPGAPIDIAEARRILDEDHFGLEKIKRRILEYLAVRKLNPEGRSPILCFVGPPGVGKTSLGQSIARATGRKFVRVSLGGVHDEAEIRGHRRTYIGSLPGNVIQNMRKAGTRNCVMMLDEVDKLGAGGFHGDPSSALLEVLDPEQNSTFRDNYLAVPYDLSRVMFICTANVLDTIPGPLRDRMEIIQLPGYTAQEKLQIARRYLVPRQLEATGLASEQCEITDEALLTIIHDYTREAGVRNLEREIGQRVPECRRTDRRRHRAEERHRSRRSARDPGRAQVRGRSRDAQRHPGRRHRTGLDAVRRRHPVHRGGAHARQRKADPHRPARRRDEGERAGGAVAGEGALDAAWRRCAIARQVRHSRSRAGGRDAQGWTERRRRDVRRADVAPDRTRGAQRRGDDGRDQPARPRAADRRGQGEGARGIARGHQHRDAADAQPARPRGHSGRCARATELRLDGAGRRRAGNGVVTGERRTGRRVVDFRGGARPVSWRLVAPEQRERPCGRSRHLLERALARRLVRTPSFGAQVRSRPGFIGYIKATRSRAGRLEESV